MRIQHTGSTEPRAPQSLHRSQGDSRGCRADGYREVLGVDLGNSENETFWTEFLGGLTDGGLHGVRLVMSDAHARLLKAMRRVIQDSSWQRCRAHAKRLGLVADRSSRSAREGQAT